MAHCSRKFICVSSLDGFKRLSYKEWRPVDVSQERQNEVVICVHGLTRNSSDFDYLAEKLSNHDKFRVVCVDISGRGESDWLSNGTEYSYGTYISQAHQWIPAVLNGNANTTINWVGTSMGGILGMMISASTSFPIIERLVLNDIGPFVSAHSLTRLCEYCGKEPQFADFSEAKKYFQKIYAPFGNLTDDQWEHLTTNSITKHEGHYSVSYDQKISRQLAESVTAAPKAVELWEPVWDKLPKEIQILLLKGADSDILTDDTVEEMKKRGPGLVNAISFPNVGHAPALLCDEQTDHIREFFTKN